MDESGVDACERRTVMSTPIETLRRSRATAENDLRHVMLRIARLNEELQLAKAKAAQFEQRLTELDEALAKLEAKPCEHAHSRIEVDHDSNSMIRECLDCGLAWEADMDDLEWVEIGRQP